MTVSTQGVKSRRRRRRRHVRVRISVFFIWVILIFTQLCFSSAEHDEKFRSGPSPARKARFFFKTAAVLAASSPSHNESNSDTLYGEDKRLVHTGPNPLHN